MFRNRFRLHIMLLIIALTSTLRAVGSSEQRFSIKSPSYLALSGSVGSVLPTCDYFSGENAIPLCGTQSLKYIFTSSGDNWQQVAYGLPYYGVGLSVSEYGKPDEIGTPLAIYLVQGATIGQLSSRVTFNYEWNLGLTTNWRHYDPFENRENTAIGSTSNVHLAASLYLKWQASARNDIHLGATLFHASNGSSVQPNQGINTASLYLELTHNFNAKPLEERFKSAVEIPEFEPHFEHDVQVILSSKNVKADNDVPNGVNDHQFGVYGLNYYSMRATNYKYKYGVGLELLYDESSNASIYRRYSDLDEMWYELTDLAPLKERLSVGVTLRTEAVMPLYSIFIDLGYSVIQPNVEAKKFYQTLGVRVPLQSNFYGTFGIRTSEFSVAQFLYWSLGYTFNRNPRR